MNRRGFFQKLSAAVAGFTILPPATTYARVWRATNRLESNPDWIMANYEIGFAIDPIGYYGTWRWRGLGNSHKWKLDMSPEQLVTIIKDLQPE